MKEIYLFKINFPFDTSYFVFSNLQYFVPTFTQEYLKKSYVFCFLNNTLHGTINRYIFAFFLLLTASTKTAHNQLRFQHFSPSQNIPTMKKKQKESFSQKIIGHSPVHYFVSIQYIQRSIDILLCSIIAVKKTGQMIMAMAPQSLLL